MKLPENPHYIVKKFKCEDVDEQKDCMMADCLCFRVTKNYLSNFSESNCESSNSDVSDYVKVNTDVKYYEWSCNDDNHVKKTLAGVSKNEPLVLLNQQIKILNKHTYDKRSQVKYYQELKQNLKSKYLFFHVDFSKNYKNQQQREVHTGCFSHSSLALFAACC